MSTVNDIINDVRLELNDTADARYTDAQLIQVVNRAINRANRIAQRNELQFAKKKATLTCSSAVSTVALPNDFDVPLPRALWRTDTKEEVVLVKENQWEEIASDEENLAYAYLDMENSLLHFKGTPTEATTLSFYYFPTISTSAYTAGTTMPWGGRLDDAIKEYVTLRCQNIDEMDVSANLQLLHDFENQILSAYRNLAPTVILPAGPMEGY